MIKSKRAYCPKCQEFTVEPGEKGREPECTQCGNAHDKRFAFVGYGIAGKQTDPQASYQQQAASA